MVGMDEVLVVGIFEVEIAIIEAIKMTEFMNNFIADAANGDWLHLEETVFEASDLGEIVNLANGALRNIHDLITSAREFSGVLVVKIHRERKLTHEAEQLFVVLDDEEGRTLWDLCCAVCGEETVGCDIPR